MDAFVLAVDRVFKGLILAGFAMMVYAAIRTRKRPEERMRDKLLWSGLATTVFAVVVSAYINDTQTVRWRTAQTRKDVALYKEYLQWEFRNRWAPPSGAKPIWDKGSRSSHPARRLPSCSGGSSVSSGNYRTA
jgi:hypothetical protein